MVHFPCGNERVIGMCPWPLFLSRPGNRSDHVMFSMHYPIYHIQEVSYMLSHATDRSLVLIDELGRATSTTDGVAIAWAVCEKLLQLRCATLFATHFVQLSELAALYPAAKLWRLKVWSTLARAASTWQYVLRVKNSSILW